VSPNTAHSTRQRLLNQSRATGRAHGELLQQFMLERFLYRLAQSCYQDRFVLKGALMLQVWRQVPGRFTRDIDLEGFLANDLDKVADAVREICRIEAPDDGAVFDADSVAAQRIATDGAGGGIRVSFLGFLGTARIRMRIDVGFGDPIVPRPTEARYPALLGHPCPVLLTYSPESAIAEKFEAMVRLGLINSRMKDFYDIWLLSKRFDFDRSILSDAIRQTFKRRSAEIPEIPIAFTEDFFTNPAKITQWQAFVARKRIDDAPTNLAEVIETIKTFLKPVIDNLKTDKPMGDAWKAPGPWLSQRFQESLDNIN